MIAGLLTRVYAGHENCSHVRRAHANAGQGWKEERRHVEVSSTSYRREYRSTTSELRVIICRRGSRLYAAFYHDTNTRARVITCVCLRKGGISRTKRGSGGVRAVRDFTADSLIGELQLITGQESYIKDTLSNCLSPLFSPGFSFALSVSVSPDSSAASLYALHVAVDFSSRSSLVVFLLSVSTSFARTRFSHFTPGLLLSTLSLHFLRVVFLFLLPLHVSISFSSFPSFCLLRRSTFSSFYVRSPLFRRFPFFLARRFFFLPNVTYGRSRIQNAFSRGKSGGTHNYTYAPGLPASASPVRKTWKQVRYTQPRRTPRRQTARHGSTSHLHIAVTPLTARARW